MEDIILRVVFISNNFLSEKYSFFFFILFFDVACHFWYTFSFQLFKLFLKVTFHWNFGLSYRSKEPERWKMKEKFESGIHRKCHLEILLYVIFRPLTGFSIAFTLCYKGEVSCDCVGTNGSWSRRKSMKRWLLYAHTVIKILNLVILFCFAKYGKYCTNSIVFLAFSLPIM